MKNKEIAIILLENPEDEFTVSIDPNFSDEGIRIFSSEVIEIIHHDKETIVCLSGSLNQ